MKKINFKYLYSLKYDDKDCIYLTSKEYPFYFLEYDIYSESFDFPDINTFSSLYNKFYSNDKLLFSDKVSNLKKIKQLLYNLDINIVPLIRTTSGLLSLATVLSMCGCHQVEYVDNISSDNDTSVVDVLEDEKSSKEEDIYNYFIKYDMDVVSREYDNNDYIFVKEFINSNNKHQITIHDYDEFRKIKNIDFIPTWEDVILEFQNNKNIDEEKKNVILECINNMRGCKELKDLDLSILYVNAKRLNFKYVSSQDMIDKVHNDSVYAYFETATGTVFLPNDKPFRKFEFIHEVLGHGTLAYREEIDDKLFVFDYTNYLMLPEDGKYTGHSLGIMVSEGGANIIAHLATNDYSVEMFYQLYEEELRAIAELCDIQIGELLNNKGVCLYDLMYENGISTPVEYIFKMDGICKGKMYCEFSDLMERLFVDATEEKFIISDEEKQDEIINDTIKIIRNSYFKDKEELSFEYDGGSIDYNFEDIVNNYKEDMDALKNVK